MKRWIFVIAAVTLGLAGLKVPALAQTPDGETPANEGVCDVLHGGTPGLYGLCVAYCEAQDLDDFDKEPPRTKILANYNKKKQAGDPDMPCLQVPCPCWTEAELASISSDNMAMCATLGGTKLQIQSTTPSTGLHLADTDTATGRERCRYVDVNVIPPTVRSFAITADEAQTCYTEIQQDCDALP